MRERSKVEPGNSRIMNHIFSRYGRNKPRALLHVFNHHGRVPVERFEVFVIVKVGEPKRSVGAIDGGRSVNLIVNKNILTRDAIAKRLGFVCRHERLMKVVKKERSIHRLGFRICAGTINRKCDTKKKVLQISGRN